MMRTSRLLLAPLLVSAWVLGLGGISFYTPALINIQHSLLLSSTLAKLTISYFILGKAISMIAVAPVADYFKRRPLFIFGLSLFTLGSVVCLFAPGIRLLLFGRFIQGLGVSISILMGRALVNDQFPPREAANLFSIIFIGNALAITLLPILAGYVSSISWRLLFLILSAYGLLTVVLFYYLLPEQRANDTAHPTLPFKAHLKHCLYGTRSILAHPLFICFTLSLSLIDTGEKVLTTLSPFIFIDQLGLSSIHFGYLQGGFWCAHLLGLLLCSVLVLRLQLQTLVGLGVIICLVAAIMLLSAFFLPPIAIALTTAALFIFMISTGFIVPTSLVGLARPFRGQMGLATAIAMAIEFLMGFMMTAIVSHIKNHDTLLLTVTAIAVAIGLCICWPICASLREVCPKDSDHDSPRFQS